jgi:hypothetical protein
MKQAIECDRLSKRQTVLLQGRCRKSSWKVFDVELDNISEGGCCIVGSVDRFALSDPVSLRFANLKHVDGAVRWIGEARVGVEFRAPLKRRVIEELAASYGITIGANILTLAPQWQIAELPR